MARLGAVRRVGIVAAVVAVILVSWAGWAIRPRDPLTRASTAYARGDWVEAGARAREAVLARPEDDKAARLLARAYARSGRDGAARAIYGRLGTDAMEAEDLFLVGRGLLGSGQTGPAVHALRAALDVDSGHPEALDALSAYLAAAGSPLEASEMAGSLAKVPGWEVRGLSRLGPLLHDLRDPTAAEALDGALGRDPALAGSGLDPARTRRLLASWFLELGRPSEADRILKALSPMPAELGPEVDWLSARVALQEGRAAEAATRSNRARSASGSKPDPMRPEPAPFVGEARCSVCHAEIARAKGDSRHSKTLVKTGELATIAWPRGPIPDLANPSVSHEFRSSEGRVEVTTRVDNQKLDALVEFALGSNHQGQSFLARDARGRARELRISRYPTEPIWDRTIEHPALPNDEAGYLGRPISESARLSCLDCHSTNFRAALAPSPSDRPEAADRGIGCERCHGPGGHHVLAIEMKFPEPAIARPRLAPASRVMALCGECHKAPSSIPPDDPRSIRFQGPALERSRCYKEGQGKLSCVTCHDPHRDAERSPTYYEAKCIACHTQGVREPAAASTSCKVNPRSDCLGCHMPEVTRAIARSTFTDHFIRIRQESADPGKSAD